MDTNERSCCYGLTNSLVSMKDSGTYPVKSTRQEGSFP